jgi:hypothetical protein
MSSPNRKENPLKKFSEASLKQSGMYLIALRAHVGRGKTIIRDMIDSVADALPHPEANPVRAIRYSPGEIE